MLHRVNHYNIIEELGKGGMGVVYKAEDTRLKRIVALKLLSPQLANDPQTKKRFLKEAQLASSLQHQNICTIHEIGESGEGEMFICMDYYEGQTLQQKIKQGISSLDLILNYSIQITNGLSHAHLKSIIHRDIKPGNIIITREGIVKILDFGLAKLTGKHDSIQTGKALGSVYYISPEQAQGKELDHLSDLWSFGIVLYEMATGVLPFSHEYDAAVIYSILDKSPLPPTEINEDLPGSVENLIYKCLRKNREERIQSAEALLKELNLIRVSLEEKENKDSGKKLMPTRQAERRPITILVAEISDYNKLLTNHDEERTSIIVSQCQEIINSIARKYGGTITSKTDRCFTLVFGITEHGENAPVQALNASIALGKRFEALYTLDGNGFPVTLKIGINTGPAIVKVIQGKESVEYSIIGETLAFAHQLKEISGGSEILTGPLTYRLTSWLFNFIPLKPVVPEGRKVAKVIYKLKSGDINDVRKTVGKNRLVQSEMVGRGNEMDLLHYYLMKLIQGEGCIVSVIGEAGIGKSRLIAEFLKKEEINRVLVLEGRAFSSGENLIFYPLIELIRSLAGIKESDDETSAYHKLEEAVSRFCFEERSEVFPFIATLMGMSPTGTYAERLKGLEGEGLEKLILKNLRTLIIRVSLIKPLVLLIEDLHWADQSSIRLLNSLYKTVENHPILFINVFRPDYQETAEMALAAIKDRYEKHHAEIRLKSLDEKESELLINKLLTTTGFPSKIRTLINERAEGNPLFMEEVIHSIIDEGFISIENGKVSVSEKIKTLVIPETIQEVLMVRIDKLDEDSRTIVKIASVIGRNFFQKVLFEVADDDIEVDRILGGLLKIQLINESRRMEEVEYKFKHALIQQAAYETILPGQRKELHLKVARSIETVFGDRLQDFFGVLSFHYGLGEDPDRAEAFLIKAGEQALRSSASIEALHYFKEALSIYLEKHGQIADPEKVAYLNKSIGYAHFYSGHFIETAEYLEKVLAFHGMKFPKNPVVIYLGLFYGFTIFMFRIRFPYFMGRRILSEQDADVNELILKKANALSITESMRFVQETLFRTPRLTRYRTIDFNTLMVLNTIFSFGGIALSISKKILDHCAKQFHHDDIKSLLAFETMRCFHNLVAGDWKDEVYHEEQVENWMNAGELYNLVTYLGMKAHLYLERGDRTAEKILDKLSEISEIYEYDYGRLARYSHGSLYLFKFREYENSLRKADEGIAWMKKTLGNKPGLLMIYSMKIRTQIMLGDLAGAEETLKVAHDFSAHEKLVPYFLSYFLTTNLLFETRMLEESLQTGDKISQSVYKKKIYQTGKRALKNCRKIAFERVETYRLMGVFNWLLGKQRNGVKWWTKAIREAEQLGAKLELAITLEEVSRRLAEPGSKYEELNGENPAALNLQAQLLFKEMEIKIA